MLEPDRYVLLIVLNALTDYLYLNHLSGNWHRKHLAALWRPADTIVYALVQRITLAVAFYVIYGSAFAYATRGLEHELPQCTLVGLTGGFLVSAYGMLTFLFLHLRTVDKEVDINAWVHDTLMLYGLMNILVSAVRWMLVCVITCKIAQ